MPQIGIVDDREEQRKEIIIGIDLSDKLPVEWHLSSIPPLQKINEYPSWIVEHDIAVLIVDEKLNENSIAGGYHVSYYGHDLINYLRELNGIFTDFPIFVITAYDTSPELKQEESNTEFIIKRRGWTREAGIWVPRIVRAGQRYFETHTNQLEKLGRISQKLALGEASEDEIKELDAIRVSFELPLSPFDEIKTRSEWIKKFEGAMDDFQKLQIEVEEEVNKNNPGYSNEMEKSL
jgi:hypothetical protein